MNVNLLNIVKQIITDNGEGILSDPVRLKAFFSDLAKDEPKPLRIAFGRGLEAGAYIALKTAPDAAERALRKGAIAQRLRDEQGLDMALCAEALDILEAALFGNEKPPVLCKNCGKALHEEWKMCPHCGTLCGTAEPSPEHFLDMALYGSAQTAYTLPPYRQPQAPAQEVAALYAVQAPKPVPPLPQYQQPQAHTAPPTSPQNQPAGKPQDKKQSFPGGKARHKFTTFFLVFSLIVMGLLFITLIFLVVTSYSGIAFILFGLPLLLLVGSVTFGCFLLLKWKKAGFWVLIAVTLVCNIILFVVAYDMFMPTLASFNISIIAIGILYGVLRLRGANGKSAWEQLE